MWTAENWKDYEVIDASEGERLERWGNYLLIRPDPQIIWKTEKKDPRWKKWNGHYHRSKKGGGEWEFRDLPETWQIERTLGDPEDGGEERQITFNLQPFAFKHTGVFPEQAANWEWFSELIRKAGRSVSVLNLFAYTGGATLAALSAGASVTHVDASKGMVTWARENAIASGLAERPGRWLVDDCMKFVERELRRGHKYDAVIMDPPSYGRGPKGEIWKIEECIHDFVIECSQLLSEEPLFFLINSYTTGLQGGVLTYLLEDALKGRGACVESGEVGLPVTDSGLILPCGCAGRAVFE